MSVVLAEMAEEATKPVLRPRNDPQTENLAHRSGHLARRPRQHPRAL
jgi:hypothetical protein